MNISLIYNGVSFPNEDYSLVSIIDSNWQVEEYVGDIVFREAYPTDDIDFAFCGILNHCGGILPKFEFANILGLSLIDDPEKQLYRDKAEESILIELLKERVTFGLIQRNGKTSLGDDLIELTVEGQQSISSKTKYRYWESKFRYFRHLLSSNNTDFDFLSHFNLNSNLPLKVENTNRNLDFEIITSFDYQLGRFQLTQLSEGKFELINLTNVSKIGSKLPIVSYALLRSIENIDLILVLQENKIQEELTATLNEELNKNYKNELVLKCEFKALLEDAAAIIDGKTVNKYLSLWSKKELFADSRLFWSEDYLWDVFDVSFYANDWYLISKEAPISILEEKISKFHNRLNWAILSERLPETFVFEQLYTEGYFWDFEILSGRDSEFVWLLINEIENYNSTVIVEENIAPNWDFLLITYQFSDERIKYLISRKFNLDFIHLSKKDPEFVLSCLRDIDNINSTNPEIEQKYKTNWDWKYISETWNVLTIWINLELLEYKIDWYIFLNRTFSNVQYTDTFLRSIEFKEKIFKHKDKIRPTFRQESLCWNEQLIDLFNDIEIILWQSNSRQIGFECNPTIEWTPTLLKRYTPFFTTETGKRYISKSIKSWDFVFITPEFDWNWDELSRNQYLIFDDYIFSTFQKSLNWAIISDRIEEEYILEHLFSYNWDFGVLSVAKSDKFLMDALNQNDSILQRNWDWKHLSKRLEKDFIISSFSKIGKEWDWPYLTREKFSKNEIVELWKITVKFWDWNYLLTNSFSVTELTDDEFFIFVASCLNLIEDDEVRKNYWSTLTKNLTPEFLAKNDFEYMRLPILQWDWSYLSQHPRFDFTILFIQDFVNNWNWTVLSQDWRVNYQPAYLNRFKDFWDWSYISEFSKFIFTRGKLDRNTLNKFQNFIDFGTFSRRTDIHIDQNIIEHFKYKNWDFAYLSGVKSLKPTQEFLRRFAERKWDWTILSKRTDLQIEREHDDEGTLIPQKFINKLILEFQEKDWDWQHLSSRNDVQFSFEFLDRLSGKNWDFKAISRNRQTVWTTELIKFIQRNNIEVDWDYISETNEVIYKNPDRLESLKSFLNWDKLSVNSKIEIDEDLLIRFIEYWNLKLLTKRPEVNSKVEYFIKFKHRQWDWDYFTEKFASQIDRPILSSLSDKIVWKSLSGNHSLHLTSDLITEFNEFWDFVELFKQRNRFTTDVLQALQPYFDQPKTRFLINIDIQHSPWKGYVYHFAHLSNASEIIKQESIKSRNSANQLSDSAGSVVNRRHTAHDFARFYFRPQTATQFYNENLGHDQSSEYYGRAANLGYPKCPIPIFFRIQLEEIFHKHFNYCFVSNGNMQTNYAEVFPISNQAIARFDFDNVYLQMEDVLYETKSHFGFEFVDRHIFMAELNKRMSAYKNASQQEFLVKDEISLSNLQTLEIICQSETDKQSLLNLIGLNNPFSDKIVVERWGVYHNKNSRFEIKANELSLSISTSFNGIGSIIIKTDSDSHFSSVEGDVYLNNLNVIEGGKYLSITFSEPTVYQVYFRDESRREWLLYSSPQKVDNNKEYSLQIWWDTLSDAWKKQLYLNLFLNQLDYETQIKLVYDDSAGNLYFYENYYLGVNDINFSEKFEKSAFGDVFTNPTLLEINKIINLKSLFINGYDLYNLEPLQQFTNLELITIWNTNVCDIIPIKKANLKYLYQDYNFNIPVSQIEQFKQEMPDCLVNQPEENFIYEFFYGKFGGAYIEYSPINLLTLLKSFPTLNQAYQKKVRHYTLEMHTLLVMSEFEKYFGNVNLPISKNLFRLMLALHDVGKPQAVEHGEKNKQYKYTITIINELKESLPFRNFEIDILISLVSDDPIGLYLQNAINLHAAKSKIIELSNQGNISLSKFFHLLSVYYQCDTGSYTSDAGGLPFLEHLFVYDNDRKVFDNATNLVKFSPSVEKMFNELKNSLLNEI
jgi:hypothetical protein